MKEKNLKLYNIFFPIWMLYLYPVTWLVALPLNFIIDFLVVLITLKVLKVGDVFKQGGKVIFKTWIFGFIADIVGAAFMILGVLVFDNYSNSFEKLWNFNIANPIAINPFDNVFSLLWTTIAVAIAGILIYMFNIMICFKKSELDIEVKKKLAMVLAIFTAPYLFYVPTALIYGWL